MKNTPLLKKLLFLAFLAIASTSYGQIHPLAFGPSNWYQDYVGGSFEVTTPAIIAGSKANSAAVVGTGTGQWPDIIYSSIINTQVIMPPAADSLGATPFTAGTMTGKICVIWRGVTSFTQKALSAQNGGAIACVIINNTPGSVPISPVYISGLGTVTIPVIVIGYNDGNAIENQYILSPGSVRMTITSWGQGLSNDLGIVTGGIAGWHDFAIPSNQLFPGGSSSPYKGMDGAFIANFGSHNATNVKVHDTLTYTPTGLAPSVIHTDVSPDLAIFHPSDSIYAMIAPSEYDFAPTAAGTGRFDLKYTISADSADQYIGDNSATTSFYTTDSVYSKGAYDFVNNRPIASISFAPSGGSDFMWGPMYYVANMGSAISSVQFSLGANVTGPLALGSMNIYAFKWVDGSGGPLDGYMENSELSLVSMGIYTFSGTDTSGGIFKVAMGDPITGIPGSPIVLDPNSWYYIAAEVPGGFFLGCDGNRLSSPYPRVYSRLHTSSTVEYSNSVWPGDYATGVEPMLSYPTAALVPCAFTQTFLVNSIDSFNFSGQKGLIPAIALIVNNNPSIISGDNTLCVGATIPLSDPVPGGTWSSSFSGTATVGATTGVVTGISAGIVMITYSSDAGNTIKTITVNPLPTAITGTAAVCVGATSPLGTTPGSGTWSSASTGVATIDATGIVTGVSGGTSVITYALSTGCVRTRIVTINPLPAAITGTSGLCVGSTLTLNDASGGGSWSSGSTSVATIDPGTGLVTGVATGTASITYTLTTGCTATSNVTVDVLPNPGTITSVQSPFDVDTFCYSVNLVDTGDLSTGIWSLTNTSAATISGSGSVTPVTYDVSDTALYTVTNTCGTRIAFFNFTIVWCDDEVKKVNSPVMQSLSVYPNPSTGTFTVTLSSGIDEPAVITVTNIVGEKIKVYSAMTNKPTDIALFAPAGIYFLNATTASGKWNEKVIINTK